MKVSLIVRDLDHRLTLCVTGVPQLSLGQKAILTATPDYVRHDYVTCAPSLIDPLYRPMVQEGSLQSSRPTRLSSLK